MMVIEKGEGWWKYKILNDVWNDYHGYEGDSLASGLGKLEKVLDDIKQKIPNMYGNKKEGSKLWNDEDCNHLYHLITDLFGEDK